jgi:uncharacterized protein YjbJ (UPF0337 family)
MRLVEGAGGRRRAREHEEDVLFGNEGDRRSYSARRRRRPPTERHKNWDQIQANWTLLRDKVREKWADLTDDEIDEVGGKRHELVAALQRRYGRTKNDADRDVDDWAKALADDR